MKSTNIPTSCELVDIDYSSMSEHFSRALRSFIEAGQEYHTSLEGDRLTLDMGNIRLNDVSQLALAIAEKERELELHSTFSVSRYKSSSSARKPEPDLFFVRNSEEGLIIECVPLVDRNGVHLNEEVKASISELEQMLSFLYLEPAALESFKPINELIKGLLVYSRHHMDGVPGKYSYKLEDVAQLLDAIPVKITARQLVSALQDIFYLPETKVTLQNAGLSMDSWPTFVMWCETPGELQAEFLEQATDHAQALLKDMLIRFFKSDTALPLSSIFPEADEEEDSSDEPRHVAQDTATNIRKNMAHVPVQTGVRSKMETIPVLDAKKLGNIK